MKFCYLEQDKKTFAILKKYITDLQTGIDLLAEDNKIQLEEIRSHNDIKHKDESILWIKNYGQAYRIYLNTIKELAVMFICTEREVTWENFCFFCERMNHIKDNVLEKIF